MDNVNPVNDETPAQASPSPAPDPAPEQQDESTVTVTSKVGPTKVCSICGEEKDRFADFNPRWGHCLQHKPYVPGCEECEKQRARPIRQPACKPCDSKRRKEPKGQKGGRGKGGKAKAARKGGKQPSKPKGAARGKKSAAKKGAKSSKKESKPGAQPGKRQFKGPPAQGARLIYRQGGKQNRFYAQANITEIRRGIGSLGLREERVAAAEKALDLAKAAVKPLAAEAEQAKAQVGEEGARYKVALQKLNRAIDAGVHCEARLKNAEEWREFTYNRVGLYVNHAISTLQQNTSSPTARVSLKVLKHVQQILPDIRACYRVQAGTKDAPEIVANFLADKKTQGVVGKFSNPKQTRLEQEDAKAEAIKGFFEGMIKYDPTLVVAYECWRCNHLRKLTKEERDARLKITHCPKCETGGMIGYFGTATLSTFANRWAYRNSRARTTSQEAAIYSSSIDDTGLMGGDAETASPAGLVTKQRGKASITARPQHRGSRVGDQAELETTSTTLASDLHSAIESLDDPRHQTVMRGLLAQRPATEIAAELGVTRQTFARLKKEASAILQERLSGYFIDPDAEN